MVRNRYRSLCCGFGNNGVDCAGRSAGETPARCKAALAASDFCPFWIKRIGFDHGQRRMPMALQEPVSALHVDLACGRSRLSWIRIRVILPGLIATIMSHC